MRGHPGQPDAGGIVVVGPEPSYDADPTATPTSPVASPTSPATTPPSAAPSPTPAPTPALTAAPSPAPTPAPTPSSCVVAGGLHRRRGDTLWDIAQDHGVTLDALLAANPQITDRPLIRVGDEITILPRAIDLGTPGGYPEHVPTTSTTAARSSAQVQTAAGSGEPSSGRTAAMIDLGTLGGSRAEAIRHQRPGHVVGANSSATNAGGGFLWRDGVDDRPRDARRVIATTPPAINDRDQVVGSAVTIGE